MVNCYRQKAKKSTTKRLLTIAMGINIGHFWPHCDVTLFPSPMPMRCLLVNSTRVTISTEVWYVVINRRVFKTSSLIELKYMAFHYVPPVSNA